MDSAILNTIIPSASSIATTGNIVFTKGPLAFSSLITINIPAGAVAADMLAITKLNSKGCLKMKYVTRKTNATAPITSATAIIIMFLPDFLISFSKNSLPTLKAIAARATSFTMLKVAASPDFMTLKNDGPINNPPIM